MRSGETAVGACRFTASFRTAPPSRALRNDAKLGICYQLPMCATAARKRIVMRILPARR
jgi:hypothetical protein